MNDLLPQDMAQWHKVESILRDVAWKYGYQEIRTPMLEKSALFKQSIGDSTDIVEKEMYNFVDAGEESLSLRPEATASTVRACIEHGLLHNRQEKMWYMGPMFRREKPQKGRYRQFNQFGIEAFGWPGPDIDGEVIRIGERIWKSLNVDGITLHLNTLGSESSRINYRDALKNYLTRYSNDLDEDSKRRLEKNPLRILDSKVESTQVIVREAPSVMDFLEKEERQHFDQLCEHLHECGIEYLINPKLVRGLDYYTSTVFEWTTNQLGAQSAVCAGGRYDTLMEKRGGRSVPAIGFAMGIERLVELIQLQNKNILDENNTIYFIDVTDSGFFQSMKISEDLRDNGFSVINHMGGGKLKNQLKRADQSGARVALIYGNNERERQCIKVKLLREYSEQIELPVNGLVEWLNSNLS